MSSYGFSSRLWLHREKHKSAVRAGSKLRLQPPIRQLGGQSVPSNFHWLEQLIIVYAQTHAQIFKLNLTVLTHMAEMFIVY